MSVQWRAIWWLKRTASISMPFIVLIRHRVYGSQRSGSIGETSARSAATPA